MLLIVFVFSSGIIFAQTLPIGIRTYLDDNYKGWKLQKDECYPDEPGKAVVTVNFNGDKKRDYAVKFAVGKKGYILAFLREKKKYEAFVLHDTDKADVTSRNLEVWKKGERFELGEQDVFLNYDAPADFRCESDVGGIHLYKDGKFIGY
jgi:hypothetical protein